ncbi:MAG: hypothetical protein ABI846_08750, partial [Rudaea sp.]
KVQPLSARLPRIGQAYEMPDDKTERKVVSCPASAQPVAPRTFTLTAEEAKAVPKAAPGAPPKPAH